MFIRLHPHQVTVNCVLEADTVADKPPVSTANGIKVACKVYLKINLKQNPDSSAFAGLTRLLIPARAPAPAQVGGLGAQGDGTSESSGAGGAGPEAVTTQNVCTRIENSTARFLDADTHHHRGNYPTLPSISFYPEDLFTYATTYLLKLAQLRNVTQTDTTKAATLWLASRVTSS